MLKVWFLLIEIGRDLGIENPFDVIVTAIFGILLSPALFNA